MAYFAASLTDSRIRQVKAVDKPIKLADGGGMHLLVRPDGSRSWRLDYHFEGRRKTLALGAYPEVTLAEARRLRRAAKALLAEGRDPGAERQAQPQPQPFAPRQEPASSRDDRPSATLRLNRRLDGA